MSQKPHPPSFSPFPLPFSVLFELVRLPLLLFLVSESLVLFTSVKRPELPFLSSSLSSLQCDLTLSVALGGGMPYCCCCWEPDHVGGMISFGEPPFFASRLSLPNLPPRWCPCSLVALPPTTISSQLPRLPGSDAPKLGQEE
jgi:hypothetical protein